MAKSVLVTGAAGGIGSALVSEFAAAGWHVIGTDLRRPAHLPASQFVEADLLEVASNENALAAFVEKIKAAAGKFPLNALINNAALQILGSVADVSLEDWDRSLRVNVTAPFAITRGLLPSLAEAAGVIVNIGSVHAQATKAGFVSYATSKAALHGLTKALAVDLGNRVRVICLAPAAVATDMLLAGFEGNSEGLKALGSVHPVGRIATPTEVARAALALTSPDLSFATGSTFWLDGGVLSRLHDPA